MEYTPKSPIGFTQEESQLIALICAEEMESMWFQQLQKSHQNCFKKVATKLATDCDSIREGQIKIVKDILSQRQTAEKSSSFIKNRKAQVITAIIGLVGIGLGSTTTWRTKKHTDTANQASTLKLTDVEISNKNLSDELERKAKKIDHIIALIEGDLLSKLEALESPNPRLQLLISELIKLIKDNRNNPYKNAYTLSKEHWDMRDQSKEFTYIFEGKSLRMNSANIWKEILLKDNVWKILPPQVTYSFTPEKTDNVGSYSYHTGNLNLNPNNNYRSLVSMTLLIHELVHVLQHKKMMEDDDTAAYKNFKSHLFIPKEINKTGVIAENLYILDMENQAYAASLEIANLISGGQHAKYIRQCLDPEKKALFAEDKDSGNYFKGIFFDCSKDLIDSFIRVSGDYFLPGETDYPYDNERLNDYNLHDAGKGKTVVSSEDLKNFSRKERAKKMGRK